MRSCFGNDNRYYAQTCGGKNTRLYKRTRITLNPEDLLFGSNEIVHFQTPQGFVCYFPGHDDDDSP